MAIYDWGNADCSLPASALSAGLLGEFTQLAAGDYLLFDNGQGLRDVVGLTEPPEIITAVVPGSPPSATAVTMVRWSRSTPLTGCYCLSQTVVRGNLVPATHGLSASENLRNLKPAQIAQVNSEIAATPGAKTSPAAADRLASAAGPPRSRNVRIGKHSTASGCFRNRLHCPIGARYQHARGIRGRRLWQQKPTLLDSQSDDQVYRVEMAMTAKPPWYSAMAPSGCSSRDLGGHRKLSCGWRRGGKRRAHTLIAASSATLMPWLLSVTNPVAATGGRDLESSDHARRIGPATFRQPLVAVDRIRLPIGCRGVPTPDASAARSSVPMPISNGPAVGLPSGWRPTRSMPEGCPPPCSNRCCSS